ncbi:polyadenylate-binding protein-interacting protein 5-like [Silene latifolia]|uniref:polyadenylate-binding protein-interacting protein 5-like n=1 Tax=Silene latifolia TaxID=37657 RepID=UPI003D77C700
MKTNASTLNPFALSYVPIARREVEDVDKDFKTMSKEADAAAVHDLKLKGHQAEIPQEMDFSIMDEESEMDLAYLQMIFPGVSDQSLADVYNVNLGDLEAALDMLSILEADDQASDVLNDDNSRSPVSSGECVSVKAVTAEGETSTSSGSSGVTTVAT